MVERSSRSLQTEPQKHVFVTLRRLLAICGSEHATRPTLERKGKARVHGGPAHKESGK